MGFSFYVSDSESLVLLGLWDAIKKVLKKRRLWPGSILFVWLMAVPLWLSLPVPKSSPLFWPATLFAVAAFVLLAVLALITHLNRFRRSGKVILRDSGTKLSFLRANRDQLVLVGLTVVGTFVATVVGEVIVFGVLHAGR